MTKVRFSALFLSALLLPLASFAASKTQKDVTFDTPVTVATTQLQPGTYKLQWDGSGPNTQVNFIQHKKVVATVQAQVAIGPSPYDGAIAVHQTSAGANQLDEVDFKNFVLKFGQSGATQGGE